MKKQWIIVAAVVALLTAGALVASKLTPDLFPVEVGSRAPQFHAVDLASGDSVSLDTYRGQVVLLNIWATWCEPCRIEMPAMERLYRALGPEGLRIVAVSIDVAGPEIVKRYQRELGLTFTILQDRTRAIERIYQITGVPETFVIDRRGLIVKKVGMAHEWDTPVERDLIRRLLAQPRS